MIDPAAVAFDIDGVVADTMSLFLAIARDDFGINGIRYEDLTCYNLAECIPVAPEIIDAVVVRILNGNYTAPLNAFDGAGDVLNRITRSCCPVLFVTARPRIGPIWNWLQELLSLSPDSIDVVATGSFELKADVLTERNIAYFVEDRLETCYLLQDVGVSPILFKQPWNREPHPFREVGTWEELADLIEF